MRGVRLSELVPCEGGACMGGACKGAGTIMWAHTFERLWFELFDTRVAKSIRPMVGNDNQGACFLGARRRLEEVELLEQRR